METFDMYTMVSIVVQNNRGDTDHPIEGTSGMATRRSYLGRLGKRRPILGASLGFR